MLIKGNIVAVNILADAPWNKGAIISQIRRDLVDESRSEVVCDGGQDNPC